MKQMAVAALLMLSVQAWGQVTLQEAMPADAQRALREQLSRRVGDRVGILGVSDQVVADIRAIRDPEVVTRIEGEFDKLLAGRVPSAELRLSDAALQQFMARARTRTELYDIAVSSIPEDKIFDVVSLTKSQLLEEAKKNVPNRAILAQLTRAFPAYMRPSPYILNPLTPRPLIRPGLMPIPTVRPVGPDYNPQSNRSPKQYSRERFGIVGVLADISVTPFRQICSGTLVSPNWFLTATHCLAEYASYVRFTPERLGVFFPYQGGTAVVRRDDGKESKHLKAWALTRMPLWFGEVNNRKFPGTKHDMITLINAGDDVALIELAGPVPMKPDPKIVSIPPALSISPPVTMAGWGLSNALAQVDDLLLEVGIRPDIRADDNGALLRSGRISVTGEDGRICAGDSGGPVFLNGIDSIESNGFRLVAIASAVVGRVATLDTCATAVQLFTRVDRPAVRKWLCAKAGAGC